MDTMQLEQGLDDQAERWKVECQMEKEQLEGKQLESSHQYTPDHHCNS